jgi:hypothetical protein
MGATAKYFAIGASVAIIAVCGRAIFKAAGGGAPEMPTAMQKEPVELIDKDSLQPVVVTKGEMQKMRMKDGCLQNPKTGAFNLARWTICEACNQKIPLALAPNEVSDKGPEAVEAWHATQICPRCKKCPYLAPPAPPR